jgi:hypothetical protein
MAGDWRVTPGQFYAARDEKSGRYQIFRILHADDEVVVTRRYTNLFAERPSEVPEGLRLDITLEELEPGEIGIGWGAIAIDANGFAADAAEFTLLGEEPVTDEEHENVHEALNPPTHEGLFSRLTGLFRRRG